MLGLPGRRRNRGTALASLHPDLEGAIKEVLDSAADQTAEFRRRLQRLMENATISNLGDADVREVIELATVDETAED